MSPIGIGGTNCCPGGWEPGTGCAGCLHDNTNDVILDLGPGGWSDLTIPGCHGDTCCSKIRGEWSIAPFNRPMTQCTWIQDYWLACPDIAPTCGQQVSLSAGLQKDDAGKWFWVGSVGAKVQTALVILWCNTASWESEHLPWPPGANCPWANHVGKISLTKTVDKTCPGFYPACAGAMPGTISIWEDIPPP